MSDMKEQRAHETTIRQDISVAKCTWRRDLARLDMKWQRSQKYNPSREQSPRARDGTTQTANYMSKISGPDGINPIENIAFNKIRWWHVWSLLLLLLWKWSETRMWNTHRKPRDYAVYGKASLQFTSLQPCWSDMTRQHKFTWHTLHWYGKVITLQSLAAPQVVVVTRNEVGEVPWISVKKTHPSDDIVCNRSPKILKSQPYHFFTTISIE